MYSFCLTPLLPQKSHAFHFNQQNAKKSTFSFSIAYLKKNEGRAAGKNLLRVYE